MTTSEQAKETMVNTFENTVDTNSSVYATNEDFKDEVLAFKAALADHRLKSSAAHEDNKGFSLMKLNEKEILAELVSRLSGKAYVRLTNLGMVDVAETLHIEPSDYSHASDGECDHLSQAAHDILFENLTVLSPRTITAVMLTALKDEIIKFRQTQGSSERVHLVSPDLTRAYKESFKPLMKRIKNIKLLVRDYKTSNNEFYTNVMASSKIPTINIHHTHVEVYCYKKSTGRLMEGVVFTLAKSNKSATTDWEGMAEIDEVRGGKDVLTGVFQDKTIYTAHIVIRSGRLNHFAAAVEDL